MALYVAHLQSCLPHQESGVRIASTSFAEPNAAQLYSQVLRYLFVESHRQTVLVEAFKRLPTPVDQRSPGFAHDIHGVDRDGDGTFSDSPASSVGRSRDNAPR